METRTPDQETVALLRLARQLRLAAAGADRPDVVAKVDEVLVLIADGSTGKAGEGRANALIRFLDGLGL